MFAGHGIGPDRLTFAGGTSRADHLAAIGQVDIALDSFPYAGGLTTLETLWMGVPVVTYPADTLCSRHSLGYLTVVGLSSMAATDAEMYVRIAAGLASDIQRLSELRAGLRDRLLASPLLDGEGFARDLLAACGLIWDRWRVGLPPVALSL